MKPKLVTLRWKAADGQQLFVKIDATTRETHTFANDVTDHPVERGAAIADHIRPTPLTLSLEGHISNAPHYLPDDHAANVQRILEQTVIPTSEVNSLNEVRGPQVTLARFVRGPAGIGKLIPIGDGQVMKAGRKVEPRALSVTAWTFSAEFDRPLAVFEELIRLRNEGVLLTAETPMRTYADMAIVSLEAQRESTTGDKLQFTLQLKQVRFGQTVAVPVPVIPTARTKKGTATPTADTNTPAILKDKESMTHYLARQLGAFGGAD